MFGIAKQLLAVVALAVGTTIILRERGAKFALGTGLPLCFVGTMTLTAAVQGVLKRYLPRTRQVVSALRLRRWVDSGFRGTLLAGVRQIVGFAASQRFGATAPQREASAQ